jgi:hypothetical protein
MRSRSAWQAARSWQPLARVASGALPVPLLHDPSGRGEAPAYARRRPEESVLYGVVRAKIAQGVRRSGSRGAAPRLNPPPTNDEPAIARGVVMTADCRTSEPPWSSFRGSPFRVSKKRSESSSKPANPNRTPLSASDSIAPCARAVTGRGKGERGSRITRRPVADCATGSGVSGRARGPSESSGPGAAPRRSGVGSAFGPPGAGTPGAHWLQDGSESVQNSVSERRGAGLGPPATASDDDGEEETDGG